jgi:DNA-directed RNA polymerase subunit RPC12/RpoP
MMTEKQNTTKGHWCTNCGKTFTTAPREDHLKGYCPACAHEREADQLLVDDLRRIIETWGMEAGLTPRKCWEVVETLHTFRTTDHEE